MAAPSSSASCIWPNWLPRAWMLLLSVLTPVTVWICAICVVTAALSIGFIGSWFCNCATSSFRNRSDVSCALVPVALAAAVLAAAPVFVLLFRAVKSMTGVPFAFRSRAVR